MFIKRIIAPALALLLAVSLLPVSALGGGREPAGERSQSQGGLVIDTSSSGGYTGDYVIIYNPDTNADSSRSTGSIGGLIQHTVDGTPVRGSACEPDPDELPPILDIDAEIAEYDRQHVADYGKIDESGGVRTSYGVGSTKEFYVSTNYSPSGTNSIRFKVLAVGEHCYVWTPYQNLDNYYTLDSIDTSYAGIVADEFDRMYQLMNASFGSHSNGSNGDGRVSLLFFNLDDGYEPGVSTHYTAGYFSGASYTYDGMPVINLDTYPGVYRVSASGIESKDITGCFSTACHEYQHCINYSRGHMSSWLNESFSSAAQEICYPGSCMVSRIQSWLDYKFSVNGDWQYPPNEFEYNSSFGQHNGPSAYTWDGSGDDTLAQYAQGALLSQYLYTQYGNTIYNSVLGYFENGYSEQNSLYRATGVTCSELIKRFRIAMYANDPTAYGGRYGFAAQTGYDPAEHHGVASPYDLLGPLVFTGSSCSIAGGGAICVKPVGGVFYPPSGADSGLVYVGITREVQYADISLIGISISPDELVLLKGEQEKLTLMPEPRIAYDFDVEWSCSDRSVAMLVKTDNDVLVMGLKAGTALVTAEATDNATGETFTAEATVIVTNPPRTVYAPADDIEEDCEYLIGCDTGDGVFVMMSYNPDPIGSNYEWFYKDSSNNYIAYGIGAETDSSGNITALDTSVYPDAVFSDAEWYFESSGGYYSVVSAYDGEYSLYIYAGSSSAPYTDLYARQNNTTRWAWDADEHMLYTTGSAVRFVGYLAECDGYEHFFQAETEPRGVSLYKKIVITEPIPVSGAEILPTSLTVTVGETADLALAVRPNGLSEYTVDWYSGDAAVASVSGDASGAVVVGVSPGFCTVTADVTDELTGAVFTAEAQITVGLDAGGIRYVPTDEIEEGSEYLIGFDTGNGVCVMLAYNPDPIGTNCEYYKDSSNNYIAYGVMAVTDSRGNITALDTPAYPDVEFIHTEWLFESSGSTYTIASAFDTEAKLYAYPSQNYTDLYASTGNASNWVWDAAAHSLYVSGAQYGKYVNYLPYCDGYEHFFNALASAGEVRLYKKQLSSFIAPLEGITVSPETASVLAGWSAELALSVQSAAGYDITAVWQSGDESVAIVSGTNAGAVVTGIAEGVCTVTVTVTDNLTGAVFTASAEITVAPVPNCTRYVPVNEIDEEGEYLIGYDTGDGVYILLAYNPDVTSCWYYKDGDLNYLAYGVRAVTDGTGCVVGVDDASYPTVQTDLAEWRFVLSSDGSYLINSASLPLYYLRTYQNTEYKDLYAGRGVTSSSYWIWQSASGTLASADGSGRSVSFLAEHEGYCNLFQCSTETCSLRLYRRVEAAGEQYHTVTFVDHDGGVIMRVRVADGASAPNPPAPTRTGYTFAGWDGPYDNVTEDTVIHALYTVNSYTLTINYVFEDGSEAAPQYSAQVEYGAAYSVNSPAVAGFAPDVSAVEGVMGAKNVTVTVTYSPASLPGDVDGDGRVSFSDVSTLYLYMVGQGSIAPELIGNADFDGDGNITFTDITELSLYIMQSGA